MDNYSLLLGLHLQTGLAVQFPGLDLSLCLLGTVAEAVELIAGFNDVTVMGEPVQQCCGHLGITEDGRPLRKRQVGGDQNAGVLIPLGTDMLLVTQVHLRPCRRGRFLSPLSIALSLAHLTSWGGLSPAP